MYKLRFQKCGPYCWGDVHVVVGGISAIHTLYNTLGENARNAGAAWKQRFVAEVTVVNDTGEFEKVFEWGTFKPPGTRPTVVVPEWPEE